MMVTGPSFWLQFGAVVPNRQLLFRNCFVGEDTTRTIQRFRNNIARIPSPVAA